MKNQETIEKTETTKNSYWFHIVVKGWRDFSGDVTVAAETIKEARKMARTYVAKTFGFKAYALKIISIRENDDYTEI